MSKIKIKLRDSETEFEAGVSGIDIAASIGAGLAKAACAVEFNSTMQDLRVPIETDGALEILTFDSKDGKHAFWHSSSHVMAQALMHLYPEIQLAIGPAIENGFYYDVDIEHVFTPDDFEQIEAEMERIVKQDIPLERFSLPRDEALSFMKDQMYKVELISDLPEDAIISFYRQGDFVDLCAGPHLMTTGPIKSFKITSVTGAYWRGDSNNKMLQRIYGISFPKKQQLEDYLTMLEEAKKRDHRRLGRELDLFDILEEGPGFPFFLPKGMIVRNELESLWRSEHYKAGYHEIKSPIILNRSLWETSGHWFHYKENMYTTIIDEEDFAIKPMNCPGALLVYNSKMRSYRDLPYRIGEMGLVHRHELSGSLHGLMRVRAFTQDDAHIFMTEEQIEQEILGVIRLTDRFYSIFGFDYELELSTRPEVFMGDIETWNKAEEALKKALEKNGKEYSINEGDGAFYGPKIDFHIKDSMGRRWQCATIQLDYQMAERFDTSYIGADGEKHRPILIHRVVFGAIERFIAIMTEHFAGAFPVWLAPVQVEIIPISENHHDYARQIESVLYDLGLRVEVDDRNEKMGYKIREAQLNKIPFMLVVGEHEKRDNTVSLRSRVKGDEGNMSLEAFIEIIQQQIRDKTLPE
ncbi:MAG: threonine--tRNA ligase [Oscillospiraceae bacterium]|nr:threonine--tRNA ligase [Oscillospiraceae bacterium]